MARAVLACRVRALRGGSYGRGVQVSACTWDCGWGTGRWVQWGWGRLSRGVEGARAQVLGLCPHARVRVSFPASSGLLARLPRLSCLPHTHASPSLWVTPGPASPRRAPWPRSLAPSWGLSPSLLPLPALGLTLGLLLPASVSTNL